MTDFTWSTMVRPGDEIEFELGPDGFCSRWTENGYHDRGPTNHWRRAIVIRRLHKNTCLPFTARTGTGDEYTFKSGYPMRGLRLISSNEIVAGVRLVEKIDPVTKKPYYATETKRSDARTATELLDLVEKAQRKTQRLGKIVCAECGGTDTNPKIRGCSGVIHDQ